MITCKCGQENEDSGLWCKKCNRKLLHEVDKSKQVTLEAYNETK